MKTTTFEHPFNLGDRVFSPDCSRGLNGFGTVVLIQFTDCIKHKTLDGYDSEGYGETTTWVLYDNNIQQGYGTGCTSSFCEAKKVSVSYYKGEKLIKTTVGGPIEWNFVEGRGSRIEIVFPGGKLTYKWKESKKYPGFSTDDDVDRRYHFENE